MSDAIHTAEVIVVRRDAPVRCPCGRIQAESWRGSLTVSGAEAKGQARSHDPEMVLARERRYRRVKGRSELAAPKAVDTGSFFCLNESNAVEAASPADPRKTGPGAVRAP